MSRIFDNPFVKTTFPADFPLELTPKESRTLKQRISPNLSNNIASPATGTIKPADGETFLVTKPLDAKGLSRNLLKEHFGLSDKEIKDYEAKYGRLVFNDAKKCFENKICTEASPEDIKKWETLNGKVPVSVSSKALSEIREFKTTLTIDKAVMQITDSDLRQQVKTELSVLATGEGQARIDAAERLAAADASTFADAEAVRNAIRAAANSPEFQNNSVIQLLSAKVDLEKAVADVQNAFITRVNTPQNTEKNDSYKTLQNRVDEYEARLQHIADNAGGVDNKTLQRTLAVNRTEAAWVNQQLGEIYRQTGDDQKALERNMISRYYTLDDGERSKSEFKLGIPRIGLDGTVYGGGFYTKHKYNSADSSYREITPLKPAEQPQTKELAEEPFKRETFYYEKRFKIIEQRFSGQKSQTTIEEGTVRGYERNYNIEGAMRTEGIRTTEQIEFSSKKKKVQTEIYSHKSVAETYRSETLNPVGTQSAVRINSKAAVIQEFNNWFPIIVDNFITHKSLNDRLERENTERKIFLQNNYPIPPEPKDLPRIKLKLETQFGKQQASFLMKKIEEMSYAAFGK